MGTTKLMAIIGMLVLLLIIVVFAIGYRVWWVDNQKTIWVSTDNSEYTAGQNLKVKIKNNFEEEKICFSSCYPYYFEKKNGKWESYNYSDCEIEDKIEKCLNPKETKAFELVLPDLKGGTLRLAIPICKGCNVFETFQANQWLYSNEFTIK